MPTVDTLIYNSNVFRRPNCISYFSSFLTEIIQRPVNPATPSITLVGPTTLVQNICEEVLIAIVDEFNDGKRSLSNIVWTTTSPL